MQVLFGELDMQREAHITGAYLTIEIKYLAIQLRTNTCSLNLFASLRHDSEPPYGCKQT